MVPSIVVSELSKQYRINVGFEHKPATTWTGAALNNLVRPVAYGLSKLRKPPESQLLWALRKVSFEVQRGEVLGIIGPNGSGKSTLLKVLSRITEPTEGWAEIRGRVGSLLEVGTGFHPELTGRENVYMNGAILGMRKSEIDRQFDDIVEFAGPQVSRMIDTPVKRYSSGMHVRLGFAVAAHLQPEVLLIDEVLAVGDAKFLQRSYNKIKEIRASGHTILFVSHVTSSITELCTKVVWLHLGEVQSIGKPNQVVHEYLDSYLDPEPEPEAKSLEGVTERDGKGDFRFSRIELKNGKGDRVKEIHLGSTLRIVMGYQNPSHDPLQHVSLSIVVRDEGGDELTCMWTKHQNGDFSTLPPEGEIECTLPKVNFAPGNYTLDLRASVRNADGADQLQDYLPEACSFPVLDADYYRTGRGVMGSLGRYVCEHSWSAR